MIRSKKVNIFLLSLLALGSFYVTKQSNQKEQSITKLSAWSGLQTSNEGNYYTSVTGNETPSALKSKLKGLISTGTNESYNWSRYEAADESEGDASKVLLIYSRINLSKTAHVSGSVGWNREHSFAKSLFNDQAPAVNDNHHIFADDNKTNGHRGNKAFNELNPATSTRSIDSYGNTTNNYYTSTYFMPNDLAKGEVARATMYMNTRYDYSVTLNFFSVELMLEWHLANPVTNREIYRNNTVHHLQGNRNPYIDRQDWACYIYGNTNSATQSLCSASNVVPTSISVSPSNASLNLGSNLTLNATVLPLGASSGVTWSSLDPSIATVSNGVVTPVSVGVATIRATSTSNTSVYGSATITVTNQSVPVTGVSISPSSLNLEVGSSASLTANVMPANATNKNVTWTSSHPSIASINHSGQVTALAAGSGTITVTTSEGGLTDTISFTVIEQSLPPETNNFSFGPTGNAEWANISGFAKYFTSAYGISNASTGGTLKSTNILKDIPLGSIFTINIAAATNSASSKAQVTIYGLTKDGSRIPNVSSSFQTANFSTSTESILRNHALNNPGILSLSASMNAKIYALELIIASASSKTLLAEISVSYSYNSAENQALAFANYVNSEGGQDAYGQCDVILLNLVDEFNRLSEDARSYFENASEGPIALAKARLSYLSSWVNQQQTMGRPTFFNKEQTHKPLFLLLLIGLTSLSLCVVYRKKMY